jgi:biopolymer transport protein ExbB
VFAAAQGGDGKLLAVTDGGGAEGGSGDSHAYLGVLLDSLTTDAWVVIIICGIMLVISIAVMITKGMYVQRVDGANQRFLREFTRLTTDMTLLKSPTTERNNSSLFRLYQIGIEEFERRLEQTGSGPLRSVGAAAAHPQAADINLSVQTLGAIQSSMNGGLVRENHKLNKQMVLLTIAISGGPFLGLLGTVVGVMITFAAIAAAGDVNVNAIAPGIAAALLATVAGLGVAIPALFGYNYLATRIKTVNADMQVFVEEFMARLAENYSR